MFGQVYNPIIEMGLDAIMNHQSQNHRRNTKSRNNQPRKQRDGGYQSRNVSCRIVITSQTNYHLNELALQEHKTIGQIVDKLMRTYLASRQLDHFN